MADGNGNSRHISPLQCTCEHGASYDQNGCSAYKKDDGKDAIIVLQDLDQIPEAKHVIIQPSESTCGSLIVKWGAPSSQHTIFHEPLPGEIETYIDEQKGTTLEIRLTKKKAEEPWNELWLRMQ